MSKQQYRICMDPKYYPKELYDKYNGTVVSEDDLCANIRSDRPITIVLDHRGNPYPANVEPITESQDLQKAVQ